MSLSVATALSGSDIALRLMRTDRAASRTQVNTAQAGTAITGGVSERAAYEDNLDRSFRLSQANVYQHALEQFHMSYRTAGQLGLALEAQGEALAQGRPQGLASFAPEDAQRLAALGTDSAMLVPEFALDQAAFDDLVIGHVQETYKDQPGFAEALATGSVVIQRASDVPEFNFGHKSFVLFKDGSMIGGAGWGKTVNQGLYDRVAATGLQQGFGGVMGQDYYVTWPGVAEPEAG
jgi:hypothetical protein